MRSKIKIFTLSLTLYLLATPLVAGGQTIVINEFFYQDPGTNDWIEYKNVGSTTIDISNWFTCSGILCVAPNVVVVLAGDRELEPGEIVVLDLAFFADEMEGELALRNPEGEIVDFMQYGSGIEFEFSDDAVAAGLWTQPLLFDFVPTSAADESASWCGRDSGGGRNTLSTDFENGPPTLGTDNPCAPLFTDGFESGNVAGWSGATGG